MLLALARTGRRKPARAEAAAAKEEVAAAGAAGATASAAAAIAAGEARARAGVRAGVGAVARAGAEAGTALAAAAVPVGALVGLGSAGNRLSRAGRRARLPVAIRERGCRGARSRAGRSQPFRKAALESGRQPARKITHFALFVVPVAPGSRCLLLSRGDGRGRKIQDNSRRRRIHSEIEKNKNQKKIIAKKRKKKKQERHPKQGFRNGNTITFQPNCCEDRLQGNWGSRCCTRVAASVSREKQ
uniref:uncharacterized protein LOC120885707 n=1 Tax=Ictidomys tridecemlineatus TaxID=43179 RepID=UPI001A9D450F|nr:uncharacterized protein LOC120885707 [Ictidomys tridecemlineatus]